MLRFLSQENVDQYYTEGYVLCKAVYSEEEIIKSRKIIDDLIQSGRWKTDAPYATDSITTDIYNLEPELADIVFNQNYINAIKDIYGDQATIIPEPSIHRNRYFSWHKDSSFIDSQGDDYHLDWDSDFQASMTVMYLQDNSKQYGGGITVVPNTQRDPDFWHTVEKMSMVQRAILKAKKIVGISKYDQMNNHPDKYWIPNKAGDLIILDMRTDHKGSDINDKINRPYDKYAITNIACKHASHADKIRVSLRKRPNGFYENYLKDVAQLSPAVAQIAAKTETRFII